MQLNADPAELASAATDLVLAGLALLGVARVKRRDWRFVFALMALASGLGALVHGWTWSDSTAAGLWWPLDFSLAATLACFAGAAVRDRFGAARARRAWIPLLALAAIVASVSRAIPDTFLPFLAFEAMVLIGAGLSWCGLARAAAMPGSGRLAAGCGLALAAGAVGASGARLEWMFSLDSNSLFHLVQVPALLLWISGARAAASKEAARA